jgi:hypothetical protein
MHDLGVLHSIEAREHARPAGNGTNTHWAPGHSR